MTQYVQFKVEDLSIFPKETTPLEVFIYETLKYMDESPKWNTFKGTESTLYKMMFFKDADELGNEKYIITRECFNAALQKLIDIKLVSKAWSTPGTFYFTTKPIISNPTTTSISEEDVKLLESLKRLGIWNNLTSNLT